MKWEIKFLVPNYSYLQNPWLGGYRPQIPVLSVLNWICWTPSPRKNSWVRHCLRLSVQVPLVCDQLLFLICRNRNGNYSTPRYTTRKCSWRNCISKLARDSRRTAARSIKWRNFSVERPKRRWESLNPYPTAFPYGNDMVLHFYQQQERGTTKTVHKVINKGLKTYV